LVVRAVSTVGNYDYTIDYIFYLDGSIEVKVRASGFIFGASWPSSLEKRSTEEVQQDVEYGYRVHDAVSTSMHDHVLNFKADLDVAGTANTLMRVGIGPLSTSYPWYPKGKGESTMHLTHSPILTETSLTWPSNADTMYVIVNNDSKNAWAEKRGYRITPGTGMGTPPHLTILNSSWMGKSAGWARKDLFVLRQKDTEPNSASPLNVLEPSDPLVDFSKFLNDEDIEQEDL
jgi:primary-amine oxidase